MKGLVLITDSVHNIPNRVRSINDDYRIYYNKPLARYELHSVGMRQGLQMVLPFGQLDKRTVDYINNTRIEKQLQKIKAMDEYNAELQAKRNNAILDKAEHKVKSLMLYLKNGGEDIPAYEEL